MKRSEVKFLFSLMKNSQYRVVVIDKRRDRVETNTQIIYGIVIFEEDMEMGKFKHGDHGIWLIKNRSEIMIKNYGLKLDCIESQAGIKDHEL